jgi:hypothetical protein
MIKSIIQELKKVYIHASITSLRFGLFYGTLAIIINFYILHYIDLEMIIESMIQFISVSCLIGYLNMREYKCYNYNQVIILFAVSYFYFRDLFTFLFNL